MAVLCAIMREREHARLHRVYRHLYVYDKRNGNKGRQLSADNSEFAGSPISPSVQWPRKLRRGLQSSVVAHRNRGVHLCHLHWRCQCSNRRIYIELCRPIVNLIRIASVAFAVFRDARGRVAASARHRRKGTCAYTAAMWYAPNCAQRVPARSRSRCSFARCTASANWRTGSSPCAAVASAPTSHQPQSPRNNPPHPIARRADG